MTTHTQGWTGVELSTPVPRKTHTPQTHFRRSTQQSGPPGREREFHRGGTFHPSTPGRHTFHPSRRPDRTNPDHTTDHPTPEDSMRDTAAIQ